MENQMNVNEKKENTNSEQKDWEQTKVMIGEKWSKISEEEINTMKGNLTSLKDKLETLYGLTKEKAQTEYNNFIDSINQKEEIKEASELNPKK
jgi:hypothetical protein